MANVGSAYEVVASWHEPRSLLWTTDYFKKLLIERHNIRAALENPGGSIITGGAAQAADADQLPSYSSELGNAAHLDLLTAEEELNRLEAVDRIELLAWCDGLSPKQAAEWANINGGRIRSIRPDAARQRIHRAAKAVVEKANGNEDGD